MSTNNVLRWGPLVWTFAMLDNNMTTTIVLVIARAIIVGTIHCRYCWHKVSLCRNTKEILLKLHQAQQLKQKPPQLFSKKQAPKHPHQVPRRSPPTMTMFMILESIATALHMNYICKVHLLKVLQDETVL